MAPKRKRLQPFGFGRLFAISAIVCSPPHSLHLRCQAIVQTIQLASRSAIACRGEFAP
jgi:hypothetical protein